MLCSCCAAESAQLTTFSVEVFLLKREQLGILSAYEPLRLVKRYSKHDLRAVLKRNCIRSNAELAQLSRPPWASLTVRGRF